VSTQLPSEDSGRLTSIVEEVPKDPDGSGLWVVTKIIARPPVLSTPRYVFPLSQQQPSRRATINKILPAYRGEPAQFLIHYWHECGTALALLVVKQRLDAHTQPSAGQGRQHKLTYGRRSPLRRSRHGNSIDFAVEIWRYAEGLSPAPVLHCR